MVYYEAIKRELNSTSQPWGRQNIRRRKKKLTTSSGDGVEKVVRKMRISHVVVLAALLSGSECTSGPTNSVPTLRRALKTDDRSVVAR